MKVPISSPSIKSIRVPATIERAQHDYAELSQLLGTDVLNKKFSGMVVDMNHAGPRSSIVTLAMLYREAKKHGLEESFIAELRQISSFFSGDKYRELTERYLALIIASQEFPDITTALPEHKVLGDSNPDWTFRTKQKNEFYLEVSAISIQKVINDLQAFGGRIPTSKLIGSNKDPLYFEIVFPDDPHQYDPAAIAAKIISSVKTQQLPVRFIDNGVRIVIDLLATRRGLPQLISNELNDTGFLKSTRLMGDRLAYTLATKISFKSIDRKIDEKKRSNKLDKIGNAWLCIFLTPSELDAFAKDSATVNRLRLRISKSKWLKGLVLAELFIDTTGTWELRYVKLTK